MGQARLVAWAAVLLLVVAELPVASRAMAAAEKAEMREKVREMFNHAYGAYMEHAYPADELMPLTCKGRVRGVDRSRGDIDDALGRFSLTLIDTLDSLVVLNNVTEFVRAVQLVIRDVKFDADLEVSVFETNIRVLGGLLGAHSVMMDLIERARRDPRLHHAYFDRYNDELLFMALDVGERLYKAFDTKTGIPYSKINLLRGVTPSVARNHATCTACAGTMIMEFATLSRLSLEPKYENAARRAMEALWVRRGRHSDLVGTTINITTGDWIRTESGVGAGIDSYYEYLLKAYVMLGDDTYLHVFNRHYASIMRHLKRGPFLYNAQMHNPTRPSRNFMDSLQSFWPGLQVMKGDIYPAIETHRMYYHITEIYGFLPEAFTADFKVNWANYPLRPEFAESTYHLYKATGDNFYLDVGKSIIDRLERHARVSCGYAAILDVRRHSHEDKMDSFVLAETFKYLFLLFAEDGDVPIDVDDYIFSTEAHLFPLSLSLINLGLEPFRHGPLKARNTATIEFHDHSCEVHYNETEAFFRLALNPRRRHGKCPRYPTHGHQQGSAPARPKEGQQPVRKQTTYTGTRVHPRDLNLDNEEHLAFLAAISIVIDRSGGQGVRLVHHHDPSSPLSQEGLEFMKELISVSQDKSPKDGRHPVEVTVSSPHNPEEPLAVFEGGPALFGPSLDNMDTTFSGSLVLANPQLACGPLHNADAARNKILVTRRGGCMFIDKARIAEAAGAIALVVMDNKPVGEKQTVFTMSGDGRDDVGIASAFLGAADSEALLSHLSKFQQLTGKLAGSSAPADDSVAGAADTCAP